MSVTHPMLANDVVVLEDNCNLSCKYCLTGQSNFKNKHSLKLIFDPPRKAAYTPGSELKARVDTLLANAESALQLPIIKLTGGEIFWIRNIMELLRKLAERYATVVIQSNGVLLSAETCDEIKSWGNACLQLSLDAVAYEGNSYRSENAHQHENVIKRIFSVLDKEIPTEIYLVLNDRSMPYLQDTLERLMPYQKHLVVCPFPVRGPTKGEFYPRPDQNHYLDAVIDRAQDFGSLLPPRAYLQRLRRFMTEGERRFRCHLPRFAFTTFDDGVVTPCPNIWFSTLGNVIQDDPQTVMQQLGENAFYQILLAERPRIDACKGCFTPWDMLSLFFDGEVTIDELCCTPMYSAAESRARILEIYNRERSALAARAAGSEACSLS